ncbi:YiiX/YebB-like N1pC/P60 family cysteine hydrolase [Mucilaginibacter sp. P25]|uniref:Permuted papain-like amidase enzyme, YaeF/YiiX, C92 family n=1 Tax=Mucilaginibacter gossypiicola TaxID=551995 RepID=A0A1H8AZQ5_9SPHI|nr:MULTISPECIES: YiiX/YebB-like N1pC/P60 family cysteine hydrolase [Mucilaginibacter]UOE52224.1 hypothetical protein MTO98_14155 [Mucilaginibacter sp. SMC90]SEM75017.1 Permuted papain-like amidase enzyme, YaeF/YiiX, C92 family [Mucilaginibacter gossypiicola]
MPESNNKFVLDLTKLEPGDILLTISSRELSALMNRVTGCKYHHAILYVGDSSYIHSYDLGVQADNPMRDLYELEDDVIALRLKSSDDKVIQNAMNSVRKKVGTQYSLAEAKAVLKKPDIDATEANRQFCSRLVAQAYADAGVELVPNSDYCSLNDLMTSDKVEIIANVLREGTAAEIAHALEGSPELEEQKHIQNSILENARNITGKDIQTFDQIEQIIISYPEFDVPITDVIKASGYLDHWKKEMAKNPQNYSFKDFANHYPKHVWPGVIQAYYSTGYRHYHSYRIQLEVLESAYKKQPLEYSKVHIELLKNLMIMFGKMMETMNEATIELLVDNK